MMRVSLIAGALALLGGYQALAADLPPPAAPPPRAPAAYIPPPPVYNWTGFYIGGNLGAGWGGGNFTDTAGHTFGGTTSAQFVGGGQVGANYEFWGGAVIGVEADFDWLANTGSNTSSTVTDISGATATLSATDRWLTTLTGRLGYAFDRVLVYGKGGGAWVGSSTPTLTVTPSGGPPSASFSGSTSSNWGWTAGAGVEWAFLGTWSVRAEYDYVGLNNQSFTVAGGAPFGPTFTSNNRNIQLFTTGINYKFGPW